MMMNFLAQILNVEPETLPATPPPPDIGATFLKMLLTLGAFDCSSFSNLLVYPPSHPDEAAKRSGDPFDSGFRKENDQR